MNARTRLEPPPNYRPRLERHLEEFQFDGSNFSISRFAANCLHFVKCPESSRKPSNCSVRNHFVSTTTVEFGAVSDRQTSNSSLHDPRQEPHKDKDKVGDESERNVDSSSNGPRRLNDKSHPQ